MQLEDDYNMIDGIINNGSKEDIDKAKAELAEGIKSMESLAENPFVPQEMRDNAVEELAKMKSQLELLNMHDEVEVDSWLSDMLDKGDAVLTDDGGFKVNPDYYKELPRNDRHVETMMEIQAVEVMSALIRSVRLCFRLFLRQFLSEPQIRRHAALPMFSGLFCVQLHRVRSALRHRVSQNPCR